MKHPFLESIAKFKADKRKFDHLDPYFFHLSEKEGQVYQSIGILGGGLAGYLTALAFRKFYDVPVTLIESSKIPVIGVGEATTPLMEDYLFGALKLDKAEFYEQVEPTWKLGIKFFWGHPGDYYFNYPFDSKDILSSYIYNGDINHCSLNSLLMSNDSSFVTKFIDLDGKVRHHSLDASLKYAYHLDNQKFVSYLKRQAIAAGAQHLDREVVDAEIDAESGDIACLVAEGGEKVFFDFYVDCSGFRSILLEKKLGANYHSYSGSLFNDTAVTGVVPNGGHIKCYTYAESMENGWCWNIPLRHEDHRGYVFSSQFCSVDEAYAEMLRKNPALEGNPRVVHFRSGRHDAFIKGNVVGIGNSYAFVEPLESTGVHMIIEEIMVLMNNFLLLKNRPELRNWINQSMGEHWDYIRWFLSIHYKFNRKFDTRYWNACRDTADISGFADFINLYKEVGLLSHQDTVLKNIIRERIKDSIFDLFGIDQILMGQGVLPDDIASVCPANGLEWQQTLENWDRIVAHSIPVKEDLQVLLQQRQSVFA